MKGTDFFVRLLLGATIPIAIIGLILGAPSILLLRFIGVAISVVIVHVFLIAIWDDYLP